LRLSIQERDTGNFGRALELADEAASAILTIQLESPDAAVYYLLQQVQEDIADRQESLMRLWIVGTGAAQA